MAQVVDRALNVLPSRWGKILVLNCNTTSTTYDLWSIAFGTPAGSAIGNTSTASFYVSLHADSQNVGYVFSTNSQATASLTANAAVGNLAYVANGSWVCPAGQTVDESIHRSLDRYLAIVCDGTSTLVRIRVSSQRSDAGPVVP